jgi:hypothetical protein
MYGTAVTGSCHPAPGPAPRGWFPVLERRVPAGVPGELSAIAGPVQVVCEFRCTSGRHDPLMRFRS